MYNSSRYGSITLNPDPAVDINKDLIAASSTPLVLAILAEGDSYGYAILQRVRELSGGRMEWTDGMLYPVLHRLERLGHVAARWEQAETGRKRKYYRITDQGSQQLAEERRQWQAVEETLRGVWGRMAFEAVPPRSLLATCTMQAHRVLTRAWQQVSQAVAPRAVPAALLLPLPQAA